jgi:spore coat polysaccharide biosynthesis protein SpsF
MNKLDAAVIIQARMGSSRLPGKTMMPLAGQRMLHHVVNRLQRADITGPVIIATSDRPTDDFICSFADSSGVACFRGSEDDVLARFHGAAGDLTCRYIIRATADNPLVWEGGVVFLGEHAVTAECDYVSFNENMPIGLGLELFTRDALLRSQKSARHPKEREHVTPYIYSRPKLFKCAWIDPPSELHGDFRLTVDTPSDYDLMKAIYERLYRPGEIIPSRAALELLRREPHLAALNEGIRQKTWKE